MLCQLEDIKQALNIDNTISDDLLFECIKRADAQAKSYCRRVFDATGYTEYYNGDEGQNTLRLNQYPIVSVTSIHDDIGRVYGADTLLSSTDDYVVDNATGIVYLDCLFFNRGLKNIKVIYRAGYGTGVGETPIPDDLKNAVVEIAIADFMGKQGKINTVTGQQYEFGGKRDDAYEILDKYRKIDA